MKYQIDRPFSRLEALALCITLFATHIVHGNALTIDFNESQPYGSGRLISFYEESNIHIKPVGPFSETPPYIMGLSGSGIPNQSDSGTAHLTGILDEIEVQSLTNQRFDATSVKLSEYSTLFAHPQVITVSGELNDGSTVTTTFTTDGLIGDDATDFETFNFPPEFRNLRALKFRNESGGFSLDDLELNLVNGTSVDLVVKKIADTDEPFPAQVNEVISLSKASLSGDTVAFQSYEYGFTRKSIYLSRGGLVGHVATESFTSISSNGTFGIASDAVPLVNSKGEVYLEVLFGSRHGVLVFDGNVLSLAFDELDAEQLIGTDTNWYLGHEIRMTDDERVVRMIDISSPREKWLLSYDGDLSLLNSTSPLSPSSIAYYDKYDIYDEGFTVVEDSSQTKLFRRDHRGDLEEFDAGFQSIIPEGKPIQISSILANARWIYVGIRFLPYGGMSLGWSGNEWFEIDINGKIAHDGTMLTGGFGAKSLDKNSVLFNSNCELGDSIFLLRDGQIYRILSLGDLLDHDRVASFSLTRYALDDDQIVVSVVFEGGRAGVYILSFANLLPSSANNLPIQLTRQDNGVIQLDLEAQIGAYYHLLCSEDLNDFDVIKSTPATSPQVQFTVDPNNHMESTMFFKIEEAVYSVDSQSIP